MTAALNNFNLVGKTLKITIEVFSEHPVVVRLSLQSSAREAGQQLPILEPSRTRDLN